MFVTQLMTDRASRAFLTFGLFLQAVPSCESLALSLCHHPFFLQCAHSRSSCVVGAEKDAGEVSKGCPTGKEKLSNYSIGNKK